MERKVIEDEGFSHPNPYVVLCPERTRRFGSRLSSRRSSDGRWNTETGIEKLLLAAIKTVMARSTEIQASRSECKKGTRGERGTDTLIDYAAAPPFSAYRFSTESCRPRRGPATRRFRFLGALSKTGFGNSRGDTVPSPGNSDADIKVGKPFGGLSFSP